MDCTMKLVFNVDNGKTLSVSIPKAFEGITSNAVKNAMDKIIATNAINVDGNLVGRKSSKMYKVTKTQLNIN